MTWYPMCETQYDHNNSNDVDEEDGGKNEEQTELCSSHFIAIRERSIMEDETISFDDSGRKELLAVGIQTDACLYIASAILSKLEEQENHHRPSNDDKDDGYCSDNKGNEPVEVLGCKHWTQNFIAKRRRRRWRRLIKYRSLTV